MKVSSQSENQLEFVRTALSKMPRDQWMQVAVNAKVTIRTIYNVYDPARKPGYDTVYRVYSALRNKTKNMEKA